MKFNIFVKAWEDEDTGFYAESKTALRVKLKRFRLDIPVHPFLSNRFILNNIDFEETKR